MIKDYTLQEISFQTLTIPKGTILFRGLHLEDKKIILIYLMILLDIKMVIIQVLIQI
jgi:hypothetical protein